jgi:hypothetical protein
MKTPHKHAEFIKAWADGEKIQFRNSASEPWTDIDGTPVWNQFAEYRIKPEPPKYPQTKMSDQELSAAWCKTSGPHGTAGVAMRDVANAAIARAIEDGDVVPLDEHNAAFAKVLARKIDENRVMSLMADRFAEEMGNESAARTPGPGGFPLTASEIASIAYTARMRYRKRLAQIYLDVLKEGQ